MQRFHLILVSFLLIVLLAACGSDTTSSSGTSPTQAPSSPTATAKPTQPPKWTTVQMFKGNGTQKTAIFSVPDDWKILYSCTFQNISGITADGVLTVAVYGKDNTPLDVAVNATCKNGVAHTTGQTEEHMGGQVYLSIDSTGDWSLQVQVLK